MSSLPLVSAVIPSFNYGRYIGPAVASALGQDYPTLEIIVVDDGSTDDTEAQLAPYRNRICYIHQANKGLCAARNTGIKAARGEYIALLDSDDLWAPTKLAKQVNFFRRHPEAGLVATAAYTIDSMGKPIPADLAAKVTRESIQCRLPDLLDSSPFCPSSVVLRRECIKQVGGFDEALSGSGDLDMWLRVAARFPTYWIMAPLTGYRVHAESMSTNPNLMFRDHQHVLDKAFQTLPGLQGQWKLRRRGEARMYREAAWMHFVRGYKVRAVLNLITSVARWPWALHDAYHCKRRWQRARLLARICLGR